MKNMKKRRGRMKYLNQIIRNENFYTEDGLLYNIHERMPIADLSTSPRKSPCKMKEYVEYFASGVRITFESEGNKCIEFYGNDGKLLAETLCSKGQRQEEISILPIDLGVFSSHYVGKSRVVHMFVDYKNNHSFMDHSFSKVYKDVETHIEGKRETTKLSQTDRFRKAISDLKRQEVHKQRA